MSERVHYRNGAAKVSADEGVVRLTGMSDYLEMHVALQKYLADVRGFDVIGTRKVPRTTNADVLQLAAIWERALARARTDVFGIQTAKNTWRPIAADIASLTADADPLAVYPKNFAFWKGTRAIAIRLQVIAEEPPDLTFTDALVKNITALPDRLASAAGFVMDTASAAASGAADVAGEVVAGAGGVAARGLGPVLRPLMIGAGVLGGGYLLVKALEKRKVRHG